MSEAISTARLAEQLRADIARARDESEGCVVVHIPVLEQLLAEVERLAAERDQARQHVDELQEKLASMPDIGKCCCSFEGPGDICNVHSPTVNRLAARVAELEAAIGRLAKIPLHEHDRHWCAHDRDITRALGDVQPAPSGEAIAGILGSLAARTRTPDPSPVDDLPGMWDQSDLTGGETDTHTPRRGERGER